MQTIQNIKKEYFGKIDALDLDLILAYALEKPREFVLAHPERILTEKQTLKIEKMVKRRLGNEPLAYILGSREFFGYPFLVSRSTLIPRPETEMMVEEALSIIGSHDSTIKRTVIDVGTGSGNIIISVAKSFYSRWTPDVHGGTRTPLHFFATDISLAALRIARRNAKKNNVEKKIKFLESNLLDVFLKTKSQRIKTDHIIILANLPYLSKKIYTATAPNVKKFEPHSALYSSKNGLAHYEKLLKQIKILKSNKYSLKTILEFSPEQKIPLAKLIKIYLPASTAIFKKDLSGKWRTVVINS